MSLLVCIAIGFVLGWLARKDSARNAVENSVRLNIGDQLEHAAHLEPNEYIAAGLQQAAQRVRYPLEYREQDKVHPSSVSSPAPTHEPEVVLIQDQPTAVLRGAKKSAQEIDSASILLYFGAFLMIAGVGLFVGLSDFSGSVKTVTVLVLALTLYGAGLFMHQGVKRLKPAAVTLTAIGLICLPLTGVAAHFYAASALSGAWIWFVTSVMSLTLYGIALLQMRQSLIGYMSVFMCLSLWLSIDSVIHAPLYFFGWAMIVLGMIYLAATKFLRLWPEVEAPLSVSASIMVPAALLLTILFGYPAISVVHQSITVLLAAVFYALATWHEQGARARLTYFILAHILVLIGSYMWAIDASGSELLAAWVVSVLAAMQIALAARWRASHKTWYDSVLIVTALALAMSTLLAAPFIHDSQLSFALLVSFVMTVSVVAALWSRSVWQAVLGLAAMVSLPAVIGYVVCVPFLPPAVMSGWYVLLATLLLFAGHWLRRFGFIDLIRAAYVTSLSFAWLIGVYEHGWVSVAASLAVGALSVLIAYYEGAPYAVYAGTALGVMGLVQALIWLTETWQPAFAVTVPVLGLLYYLTSKLLQKMRSPGTYYEPWFISGAVVLYGGVLLGLVVHGLNWFSIGFLALAGLLTMYEAYVRTQASTAYFGAAVVLTAFELAMYKIGIREAQLYWYLWSLYVIVIAYLEREALGVILVAVVTAGGLGVGLRAHGMTDVTSVSMVASVAAMGFYLVGKAHLLLGDRKRWQPFLDAWSLVGLAGLYIASSLPYWFNYLASDGSAYVGNAAILMTAGALTCYEMYARRSRGGLYLGAAVLLVGLQWLLYTQHIYNVQIYTHLWAGYFAVLAWLASRDKRTDEKRLFTVLALLVQTTPLAWQALDGDQGMGILLLFESVAVLLIGLAIRYRLVAWWGLSAAVGSVLYQLRAYQFFALVLLGAGIIALGVYTLIKQDKKR